MGSANNSTNKLNSNWKGKGYLTNIEKLNPMMYQWNRAILRYCDGSSYSSDLSEPVIITNEKGESIKLYHRGYRILKAFITDLYQNKGLNAATDIVISGESAGGLAVYLHIENINQLIQDLDITTNNNDHKYKIVGLIDSGIFPATEKYEETMKWIYDNLNVTASINEDCIKSEGFKCMFGINVIKHIKIPLFIVGSVLDSWQIDNQVIFGNIDMIAQHSIDLQQLIESNYNPNGANQNGLWLFRCFVHTGCFDSVTINDRSLLNVFSDWYNGIKDDKYNYKYIQQYEDYSCMECEQLKTTIDNLCIGFNQYPIDRYLNGTDKIPWDQQDFDKTMELVKDLHPTCVRINFYIEWFFDVNYGKQPFEHSFIHYSKPKMLAVFKVLDWYKEHLPDTRIMTGLWNWNVKELAFDSNEAAEIHTNLVKYLIKNKGYNIRYYTPQNEPKGVIPVDNWCELMHKLYDKFIENEIDTKILTGPDSWDDYTWNAFYNDKCKDHFFVLDHHLYPQSTYPYDQEEIISARIKTHLSQQIGHGIPRRSSFLSDIGLTEMSQFPAEGKCNVDYPCEGQLNAADNFAYAIDLADYFVQSVLSGHTMILYWCLDGFDMNKNCGFWDNRDKQYRLRPWFFIWKLISVYFGSLQKVQILNYKQPEIGRILLIKGEDYWSMMIINRGSKSLKFDMSTLVAFELPNDMENCSKFEFRDIYESGKIDYIIMEEKLGNDISIEITPDSATILTNKHLGTIKTTRVPSNIPTRSPSKYPSKDPTKSPTRITTTIPSEHPSKSPTTKQRPLTQKQTLTTQSPLINTSRNVAIIEVGPDDWIGSLDALWGNLDLISMVVFCVLIVFCYFCINGILKQCGTDVTKNE